MSAIVLGTQKRSARTKWMSGLATYGYVVTSTALRMETCVAP